MRTTVTACLVTALLMIPPMASAQRLSWDATNPGNISPVINAIQDHHSVIIGEMHGTTETPELAAQIVAAASTTRPVIVGLERTSDETTALEAYVAHPDQPATRATLLAGDSWSKGMTDGRSSEAMLRMITTLAELKAKGADTKVVTLIRIPVDMPAAFAAAGGPQAYGDQSMADVIRENLHTAAGNALFVAYMGNLHALPALDMKATHGGSVSDRVRDLHPLVLLPEGKGQAWNCPSQGCGIHDLDMKLDERSSLDVRVVEMSRLTASKPAVPH